MDIQITFSLAFCVLAAISVAMFVAATFICWNEGLFDGPDTLGIGSMFCVAIYAVVWVIPTLGAWAIWATWIK